jgi:thioredoxin 1
VSEVSIDELESAMARGARVIDVREAHELAAGRVPGVVHIPMGSVPDEIESFRGDGEVYVICQTGSRSRRVCEFLAERGITAINVEGGTAAWIMSGRDVELGERAT